jgi:hypothetical protein
MDYALDREDHAIGIFDVEAFSGPHDIASQPRIPLALLGFPKVRANVTLTSAFSPAKVELVKVVERYERERHVVT